MNTETNRPRTTDGNFKRGKVLRMSNGEALKFSSYGCYPLFYLVNGHEAYCPDCALALEKLRDHCGDEDSIDGPHPNWESELTCEGCEEDIESAYGE